MKIKEFPDDDEFWLVKWIDQFRSPHLSTRSASVSVLLQRLPISNLQQIHRMTPREVSDALRLVGTSESVGQPGLEFLEPNPKIHVGTLPHIAIGRVFQRQECVGELPSQTISFELPRAEDSCREIRVDDNLAAPLGWNSKYPYRLLRAREYSGIYTEFGKSRCLVFLDSTSGMEFIIPRTSIFKRFYAPHTEFALAFSSGPWSSSRERLIYEKELENGLRTQIDPATGDWHIILNTHVPFGFEKLLAILRFDAFGSRCAESIYAEALKERGSASTNPWYASARLPFRTDQHPLRLRVKGFQLHPRYAKPQSDGKPVELKRSFLVTSIVECRWPSYLPPIWHERFNSGEGSDNPQEVKADIPYRARPQRRHVGTDVTVTGNVDSSGERDSYFCVDDDFAWTDAPEPQKLIKQSSKHYAGASAKASPPPTDAASTGEPNQQEASPSQLQVRSLVRDPVNSFKYLLAALQELKNRPAPEIDEFWIVQPTTPAQIARRGSEVCWSFLDDVSLATGIWPRGGWRMLERARRSGIDSTPGVPRCALIVGITRKGRTGYWIEIECRPTQSGYLSPFLMLDSADEQESLSHVLEVIAREDGTNLRSAISAQIAGKAACYVHQYESADNARWDANSILRFFRRIWC